jgi:hypothetical protein
LLEQTEIYAHRSGHVCGGYELGQCSYVNLSPDEGAAAKQVAHHADLFGHGGRATVLVRAGKKRLGLDPTHGRAQPRGRVLRGHERTRAGELQSPGTV